MSRLHVALAIVLCVSASTVAAAQDPFNGTWHLNKAKSQFDPGPGPEKATTTIKSDGTTWTATSSSSYEGKPLETSYTVKLDGTPAPLKGSPVADMISVKKSRRSERRAEDHERWENRGRDPRHCLG